MRISDWSSDVCSSDLRKFQLEIHEFRIAGPLDVRPCSDDREAVALVVDWLPIPDWRDGRGCAAVAAAPVTLGNGLSNILLGNHAIAKLPWLRGPTRQAAGRERVGQIAVIRWGAVRLK